MDPDVRCPKRSFNLITHSLDYLYHHIFAGSETLGPNNPKLLQLRRNGSTMIRYICGINDRDETPSASLLQKLGIEDITSVLRCRRLKWYGHV